MVVARRGLLKLFGAAPLAAKVAADDAMGAMTGMMAGGAQGLGHNMMAGAPASGQLSASTFPYRDRAAKFFSFMRKFGIPAWELQRIRDNHRMVYALDPDIAALKSFSMSVKIGMQRERNIERAIDHMRNSAAWNASEETFRQRHGFWLWY